MRLGELAQRLGAVLHGDAELEIHGVAGMEHAGPGHLTFLANPKYAPKVKNTQASAILVTQPVTDMPIASLVSVNPYHDFARALELFQRAEVLLLQEAPITPLVFGSRTYLIHPAVRGWEPSPLGLHRFQLIELRE